METVLTIEAILAGMLIGTGIYDYIVYHTRMGKYSMIGGIIIILYVTIFAFFLE